MRTQRLLFAVAMCAVLPSLALEIDLTRVKIVRSGAETECVKLALEELAKHLEQVDLRPPKALRASDAELDRDADNYARWLLRHRHFTRSRFHYGHAFKDWQDRYLRDHPDWFGLSTTPEWIRKDTNGRGLPVANASNIPRT